VSAVLAQANTAVPRHVLTNATVPADCHAEGDSNHVNIA
jgi:hypothetical protein